MLYCTCVHQHLLLISSGSHATPWEAGGRDYSHFTNKELKLKGNSTSFDRKLFQLFIETHKIRLNIFFLKRREARMRFSFVQLKRKASFRHSPIKDLPNTFYVLCLWSVCLSSFSSHLVLSQIVGSDRRCESPVHRQEN